MSASKQHGNSGNGKWWKLGGGLLLLVAIVGLFHILELRSILVDVLAWVDSFGVFAPLFFILIYVVATVLLIPASILTLGGGVLFGVVQGSILCVTGATLGATASFLVGRYLARDWVARKFANNKRFQAVDQAVGAEGWKIVGLTRLSPIFPFILLNYAFGLTNVRLWPYALASLIGMIPGSVMYVYIGSLAGDLATLEKGERSRTPGEWAFYGLGLVATILVTLYITQLARRTLAKEVKKKSSALPSSSSET